MMSECWINIGLHKNAWYRIKIMKIDVFLLKIDIKNTVFDAKSLKNVKNI